jgi:hypothetical protein
VLNASAFNCGFFAAAIGMRCHIRSIRTPECRDQGVDANKLNNDTADCVDEKKAQGFIGDAGMIGQCLERKGCKIVTPRG